MKNGELCLSYRCDVREPESKEVPNIANMNYLVLGNYEICSKFVSPMKDLMSLFYKLLTSHSQ